MKSLNKIINRISGKEHQQSLFIIKQLQLENSNLRNNITDLNHLKIKLVSNQNTIDELEKKLYDTQNSLHKSQNENKEIEIRNKQNIPKNKYKKQKTDKPTSRNTLFTRNPLFSEPFTRGDLKKIQDMTGMSYATVREVLIYQKRKNKKVVAAAETILAFNRKFLNQFPKYL